MRTTIVIGSDGSAQSDGALRFGGALARALGARVIVATAYLHMPPLRGDGGAYERLARSDAEEIVRRSAATLKGVADVETEVPFGSSLERRFIASRRRERRLDCRRDVAPAADRRAPARQRRGTGRPPQPLPRGGRPAARR